jgi:ornithine carbamoyltransferase
MRIRNLDKETCWLLAQQAASIPDAKGRTDFMLGRTAVLLFAQFSLGERLSVTAAVRQMGGYLVYQGPGDSWHEDINRYSRQLLPVLDYYVDCLYVYGMPIQSWDMDIAELPFPVINAGSARAHPANALADIVCMKRGSKDFNGVVATWLGCANGTLYSLIEAMAYFPFTLRVCLPPHVDASPLKELADTMKSQVIFVESPRKAVTGANFIFVGCRGDLSPKDIDLWRLDVELMARAAPDARLLLSSVPADVIPMEKDVFCSPASLLARQAECRLRVHKRILHWVFSKD